MKTSALFLFVGLVCVILTEVVGVTLMTALPPTVDVVGNFFFMVILPATLIVAVVAGLVLTKPLRRVSFSQALMFPAAYAVFQFIVLGLFMNPLETRMSYLITTAVVTVLVVLWRRRVS